jgi:hypothetical protein
MAFARVREWAVLLAVVASAARCSAQDPVNIAGQYELTGVDGTRNLPCCAYTDSLGSVVSTVGGMLQLGWNTAAGAYTWDVTLRRDYANGTSTEDQVRFSSGTYTWDGTTLTLMDSATSVAMSGSIASDGPLTVQTNDHLYAFSYLPHLPRKG